MRDRVRSIERDGVTVTVRPEGKLETFVYYDELLSRGLWVEDAEVEPRRFVFVAGCFRMLDRCGCARKMWERCRRV